MEKCNVNFSKLCERKVTVFVGEKANKKVEIIGQKGSYSVWTDGSNKQLSGIKGKTGSLKEVKSFVSNALCQPASKVGSSPEAKTKKATKTIATKSTTKPAA